MEPICLLTTLDQHYLPQLQVLITSLAINNQEENFSIYLLHSGLSEARLVKVRQQCQTHGYQFFPILIPEEVFRDAPVTRQYPKEMYYRLLAQYFLPESLSRILYLDPDILIINPLRPLWEIDLGENLLAAAAHTGKTELANNINRIRLSTERDYYNSGVLLMNLDACRQEILPNDLFCYVEQHRNELLLPDQDILNGLYSERILPIEDVLWNYDARNYSNYLLRSGGVYDLPWVLKHTAILHFCGKAKPWKKNYFYRFGILYRHYMQLAQRGHGRKF